VSPGHILYAHPCIIIHLKNLFNMILRHGYVPQYFGKGIVVPLIKDKNGDLSNPDNYRAITISPTISDVFELCLLDKYIDLLDSHDLQLGFKKSKGCAVAIFGVKQLFLCQLDASKAFDHVNHDTLIRKLHERNLPLCFIAVSATSLPQW